MFTGLGRFISRLLDWFSEFLAYRKGLLPILAIVFVILNFVLQLFPDIGFVANSNLFLHIGVILGFLGVLLAWAL